MGYGWDLYWVVCGYFGCVCQCLVVGIFGFVVCGYWDVLDLFFGLGWLCFVGGFVGVVMCCIGVVLGGGDGDCIGVGGLWCYDWVMVVDQCVVWLLVVVLGGWCCFGNGSGFCCDGLCYVMLCLLW